MSRFRRSLFSIDTRLLLLPMFLLLFGTAGMAAEPVQMWAPSAVSLDEMPPTAELYYDGLSGRLIGVTPEMAGGLEADGAVKVIVEPGETIYVMLVSDAQRADFEPPARVLHRSGREVLLASPGPAPRLTEVSESRLTGLRELVRVSGTPIPRPVAETELPRRLREADPMIADMVAALTEINFVATWQALDDFETRYYSTPENAQSVQWMYDQFVSFGLAAEMHEYEQEGPKHNVIATHPGVVDPSKVVYICGHFDAISPTPDVCAPGADDNASGTAAVIEAARVMSQYLFEYTVKFACFNGEEQGLIGSAAYVADIAAAGEDVIGVYNCDMISYRGTDPAPPDLILYTNSASENLATTLETAVADYLPGLLEPIVIVEALAASDHASFWNHGYQAICSIEDEAWGDDFCPWYHTCEDRIERYPHDYGTYCAKANLAALATVAVPVNPEGSYLVLDNVVIDDDESGSSNGNDDGNLNPGETIELYVSVRNIGQSAATNVSGVLTTTSGSATILNGTSTWSNILPGGQGTNQAAFLFDVSTSALDDELIPFTLTMTDDLLVRDIGINLSVVAPTLVYGSHSIDDATHGNGNGLPEPGEVLVISVTLANTGGQDAHTVEATLSSANPNLITIDEEASAPLIAVDTEATLNPPYRVAISVDAIDGEEVPLDLAIVAGSGYATDSAFNLRVGSAFYDPAESDGPWSLSAAGDDATRGHWVRVDPIGTYQDVEPIQPEDDHTAFPGTDCYVTGQGSIGGSIGEADVDGGKTTLTTPTFDLTQIDQPRINYWRWYTNDLGNNPGEDYWVVEISSDGGSSWTDLERTTASNNSWQEMSFLVSDYVAPSDQVVVRFVASDESPGSLVEAGIDDFLITGAPAAVAVGDDLRPPTLSLEPARPNPTTGMTAIHFSLPGEGPVQIRIYSVDGRRVKTLFDGKLPAGLHRVDWDGTGHNGIEAAPGVYFAKMLAHGKDMKRRIVLLR